VDERVGFSANGADQKQQNFKCKHTAQTASQAQPPPPRTKAQKSGKRQKGFDGENAIARPNTNARRVSMSAPPSEKLFERRSKRKRGVSHARKGNPI
jgi:hypothetical protein